MTATLDGEVLDLTTYEFTLLRVLAERAGRVLTREQILDLVRGSSDEVFDRSIDVHVSHLRQKLRDAPRSPRLLKTVRGVGYLLGSDLAVPGPLLGAAHRRLDQGPHLWMARDNIRPPTLREQRARHDRSDRRDDNVCR